MRKLEEKQIERKVGEKVCTEIKENTDCLIEYHDTRSKDKRESGKVDNI